MTALEVVGMKPKGVSIDSKGNVVVADRGNNRIQVFDVNGRFISAITCTVPNQDLQIPISVSVGPDNSIYVVEYGSRRVSIFDHNRKYIKSFGNKEDESIYCVAVNDKGYIYISDADGKKIHVFK